VRKFVPDPHTVYLFLQRTCSFLKMSTISFTWIYPFWGPLSPKKSGFYEMSVCLYVGRAGEETTWPILMHDSKGIIDRVQGHTWEGGLPPGWGGAIPHPGGSETFLSMSVSIIFITMQNDMNKNIHNRVKNGIRLWGNEFCVYVLNL
jgi:hypothetical protein